MRGRPLAASIELQFNSFQAAQFRIFGPRGFEHALLSGTKKGPRKSGT